MRTTPCGNETVGSDDWNVVQYQWQDYPEHLRLREHTATPASTPTPPHSRLRVDDIVALEGDVLNIELPIDLPIAEVQVQCLFSKGAPPRRCRISARCFRLKSPSCRLAGRPEFHSGHRGRRRARGPRDLHARPHGAVRHAEVATSELTVSIAPSDPLPHYPIADVRGIDGMACWSLLIPVSCAGGARVNTYPSGLRFTIIDPTSGIEVWSPVENFNYLVQEGDSGIQSIQ